MDTRTKILTGAEALERFPDARYVRGYFDPLLASHAARLAELAADAPLVVLLSDPPDPLLDARSRAQLVAGLRSVSAIVLPGDRDTDGRPAIEEEEADLARRSGLMARVRERHAG